MFQEGFAISGKEFRSRQSVGVGLGVAGLRSSLTPPLHPGGFFLPLADFIALMALDRPRSAGMASGTVKWFNATKDYGFIQPDGGGG